MKIVIREKERVKFGETHPSPYERKIQLETEAIIRRLSQLQKKAIY